LLRRIFGPKRGEVVGGWRRLHNEELRNLYGSPNIIRTMKSRRMGWAEHVAQAWRRPVMHTNFFWWEILKGREHFGDLDTDGTMILKGILKKQSVDMIKLYQDPNGWLL
jgi:hypothetical protein